MGSPITPYGFPSIRVVHCYLGQIKLNERGMVNFYNNLSRIARCNWKARLWQCPREGDHNIEPEILYLHYRDPKMHS